MGMVPTGFRSMYSLPILVHKAQVLPLRTGHPRRIQSNIDGWSSRPAALPHKASGTCRSTKRRASRAVDTVSTDFELYSLRPLARGSLDGGVSKLRPYQGLYPSSRALRPQSSLVLTTTHCTTSSHPSAGRNLLTCLFSRHSPKFSSGQTYIQNHSRR